MKFSAGAKLLGVGAAVPATVITNADLEKLVDTSDEWITSRTGIRQRRIVTNETASSLATDAAKDAIGFAGIDPQSIDLIIVATSTPDFLYPSTACLVQAAIGAKHAAAFDIEAACTGIIYALAIAQQFIGSGTFKTALVIGVDIHSRFLNWKDRNTCILFGDGAGAFIVQAGDTSDNEILGMYLRADGSGAHLLTIPNIGSSYPHKNTQPPDHSDAVVHMNGRPIYEFAVKAVPEAVITTAAQAGITVDDLDYLIPHQANSRIIYAAAERLGMDKKKVVINLDEMGNTSAASIPLALCQALKRKEMNLPAMCALVGFGAGLTWAAAIVRWTAKDKR